MVQAVGGNLWYEQTLLDLVLELSGASEALDRVLNELHEDMRQTKEVPYFYLKSKNYKTRHRKIKNF